MAQLLRLGSQLRKVLVSQVTEIIKKIILLELRGAQVSVCLTQDRKFTLGKLNGLHSDGCSVSLTTLGVN